MSSGSQRQHRPLSVRKPRERLVGLRGLKQATGLVIDAPMQSLDGLDQATELRSLIIQSAVNDLGALSGRVLEQLALVVPASGPVPDLQPLERLDVGELGILGLKPTAAAAVRCSPRTLRVLALSPVADSDFVLDLSWLHEAPRLEAVDVRGFRVDDHFIEHLASRTHFKMLGWTPRDSTQAALGLGLLGEFRAHPADPPADVSTDGRIFDLGAATEFDPATTMSHPWSLDVDLVARWGLETNEDGERLLTAHLNRTAPQLLDDVLTEAVTEAVNFRARSKDRLEAILDVVEALDAPKVRSLDS